MLRLRVDVLCLCDSVCVTVCVFVVCVFVVCCLSFVVCRFVVCCLLFVLCCYYLMDLTCVCVCGCVLAKSSWSDHPQIMDYIQWV